MQRFVCLGILAGLVGCGGDDVNCGPGTVPVGGVCVVEDGGARDASFDGGTDDAGSDAGLDAARDADPDFDGGSDSGDDAGPSIPFVVSNVVDFGGLEETGLVVGPPAGTFDTDEDCTEDAAIGICTPLALSRDRSDACVCRADEIVIGDLTIVGSRALVLLAWRSIEIETRLEVGGMTGESGPGVFLEYEDPAASRSGGSGGSFAQIGGNVGAETYGEESLVPLIAGMDGQTGCGGAALGGGGGAVQLSAGETIIVTGTINAGGGGGGAGRSGDTCHGGSGGGSGGAILIEAPRVEMRGVAAANGGGAGSGGTTDFTGNTGSTASAETVATGGPTQSDDSCLAGDTVFSGRGGNGGAVETPPQNGGPTDSETICIGDTYAGAGGGGGGFGRVRINTNDGVRGCICTGEFSPEASFGDVTLP